MLQAALIAHRCMIMWWCHSMLVFFMRCNAVLSAYVTPSLSSSLRNRARMFASRFLLYGEMPYHPKILLAVAHTSMASGMARRFVSVVHSIYMLCNVVVEPLDVQSAFSWRCSRLPPLAYRSRPASCRKTCNYLSSGTAAVHVVPATRRCALHLFYFTWTQDLLAFHATFCVHVSLLA